MIKPKRKFLKRKLEDGTNGNRDKVQKKNQKEHFTSGKKNYSNEKAEKMKEARRQRRKKSKVYNM